MVKLECFMGCLRVAAHHITMSLLEHGEGRARGCPNRHVDDHLLYFILEISPSAKTISEWPRLQSLGCLVVLFLDTFSPFQTSSIAKSSIRPLRPFNRF